MFHFILEKQFRFQRGASSKIKKVKKTKLFTYQFQLNESRTGDVLVGIVKSHVDHKDEVIDASTANEDGHPCPIKAWTNAGEGIRKTVQFGKNDQLMHGNIVTLEDEDVINIEFLIIPKYDKSSKYHL